MNKSLEVLKDIYKPYRYTIQGKVLILNTTSGDYVVKEKCEKDIKEIFAYLKSRNFTNFPTLVDESRVDVNVYEYLEGVTMPNEQKAMDLIVLVANLHNSTTFYKTVTDDTFKEVFDMVKSNIVYLQQYYTEFYEKTKKKVYMSPSEYLLMRNIYKVFSALSFCEHELDEWLGMVKGTTKKRVCFIHNRLRLDHFIKRDKEYLISWEESKIDSPVLDLVHFYQNEYFAIQFDAVLKKYLEKVSLSDDEKKLFFLLVSLPPKFEEQKNDFQTCETIRRGLDYLFKTERLVRPYYTAETEN